MSSTHASTPGSRRQSGSGRCPQHQRSSSVADNPQIIGSTGLSGRTPSSRTTSQSSQHRRTQSAQPVSQNLASRLASLQVSSATDFTDRLRNPPVRDELRGPLPRSAFGPVRPGKIGKPYKALQAYLDNSRGQHVDLRIGDEGKVLKKSVQSGVEWLQVSIPARDQEHWVPPHCIQVNEAIYYGELRYNEIVTMEDHIDTARLRNMVPGQSSQLGKAIEAQLVAWNEQQPEVDMGDDVKKTISNTAQRNKLISRIIEGCEKAGSYGILNKPDFVQSDLSSFQDAKDCQQGGIYVNRYSSFIDDPALKPVLRVGKGTVIAKRIDDHVKHGDPQSTYDLEKTHYRMARKANVKEHFVLCILSSAVDQTIAEQLFNNLLQTWAPWVITNTIFETTPEEDSRSRDVELDKIKAVKYRAFFLAAYRHKLLSDSVQVLTGWPGAVFRDGFDASHGLNVSTPLSEEASNERSIWTRIDIPDKLTAFYSHPRRVRVREKKGKTNGYYELLELGSKATNDRLLFQFLSSKEALRKANINIKEGTLVYPRIEIRLDGQPHVSSWARLQDLEIWNDHKQAAAVGVYFEYQDERGNWCEFCMQSSTFKELKNPRQRGSLTRHSQAMGLYRYLMQERLPQDWSEQENWISDYGIARVHQLHFDSFTQTFSFKEIFGPGLPRDLPKRKREAVIESELKAAGAQHLSTVTGWQGYRPQKLGSGPGSPRTMCDLCQCISKATGNRTHRCVQSDNRSDLCTNCWDLGIPCTWTPNDQLNEQLRGLVLFKGEGGRSALPQNVHGLILHKIPNEPEEEA
ncbi:uncharacterized protein HMPREF1541_05684 [Cyphellophora europaea CBS 101466]|uniref:Uncharacterized protein n=1 Tax=Cyphellophora europaea (strain CBS 101466) TaxID=1220924 RepID=W2RT22_CYPE1|nr:uncharacterized protein HMPREF1541_05684 [Cyphellophora europaea CBS 101466]ETN39460.1 hypothetical protein HMPREF1541_05684 [Cyphellophora europaea CBS 101466]